MIVSPDEGQTWCGAYRIDTVGGAYPSLRELADGTVFCPSITRRGRGSQHPRRTVPPALCRLDRLCAAGRVEMSGR